jgi:hypothetical protein
MTVRPTSPGRSSTNRISTGCSNGSPTSDSRYTASPHSRPRPPRLTRGQPGASTTIRARRRRDREHMAFLWGLAAIVSIGCWICFGLATFREGRYWMFLDRLFPPVPPDHRRSDRPDRQRRRASMSRVITESRDALTTEPSSVPRQRARAAPPDQLARVCGAFIRAGNDVRHESVNGRLSRC